MSPQQTSFYTQPKFKIKWKKLCGKITQEEKENSTQFCTASPYSSDEGKIWSVQFVFSVWKRAQKIERLSCCSTTYKIHRHGGYYFLIIVPQPNFIFEILYPTLERTKKVLNSLALTQHESRAVLKQYIWSTIEPDEDNKILFASIKRVSKINKTPHSSSFWKINQWVRVYLQDVCAQMRFSRSDKKMCIYIFIYSARSHPTRYTNFADALPAHAFSISSHYITHCCICARRLSAQQKESFAHMHAVWPDCLTLPGGRTLCVNQIYRTAAHTCTREGCKLSK